MRLLLENLSDEMGSTRALVFGVLTEMLKQDSLISSFQGFTELIILKVLEAHRDDEKDVSKIHRKLKDVLISRTFLKHCNIFIG